MSALSISFLISFLVTLLLVRYNHLHSHFSADSDLGGVQKFHIVAVPRVGGVGIILGVLIALLFRYFQSSEVGVFGLLLLFSSLPAFLAGLAEDVTKTVSVKTRLILTMASAGLAGYLLNSWLSTLQIIGVDNLMISYPLIAIIITCIAVGGVSNAFNIIDGYNGLSAMVAIIILTGITYVAFQVNDYPIMVAALVMVGGLFGFLLWNYPRGLIFLGDGGAYFIGFWIAELSILLTVRHSEISKWFPVLLCCYPIFETLFTIYRRVLLTRKHPGLPDALHLHQLIYMRVVRWAVHGEVHASKTLGNAMTSPYLWLLVVLSSIPAILFWRYHLVLKGFVLLFAVTYAWLYWSIVRFKTPRWLKLSSLR